MMNTKPVNGFAAAILMSFGAIVSGCTDVDTDTEAERQTETQAETQAETQDKAQADTRRQTRTESRSGSGTRDVTVTASEFAFEPATIRAEPGQTLTIELVNEGGVSHNLHIDGMDAKTETVQGCDSGTVTLTVPDNKDSLRFYCKVPGHEQAGMVGEIVIDG